MGAKNVVSAYQRWAGRVPALSMVVLAYMAVVSKDADDWPWYGQGQAALAEFALGRENPDGADIRAVSRAMTPLLEVGAVTVERAASNRSDGNSTARYRLNLDARADAARAKWAESPDGKRRMTDPRRNRQPQDGNRRMASASHTTKSGGVIRRKVANHTTKSGKPYDGNRRTKEEEDQEERENRGIRVLLETASHPPRAPAEDDPNVIKFSAAKETLDRRRRDREHGRAELAAKAANARDAFAAIEARRQARKEAT